MRGEAVANAAHAKGARSERMIGADRASMRYEGTRSDDGLLRARLKQLAGKRWRVAYRRLHVLLKRECHAVSRKRFQRLYRKEKLTVRGRGGRWARADRSRCRSHPTNAGVWTSYPDRSTDGRHFRILAMVDDSSEVGRDGLDREKPADKRD
ncbi:hypothetical protein GCM10011335_48400 [Aureimonas glaciei]|uniref:Transposase n=1 Tax=Aureimonas glaciei TaxID=1776957 RepID=A0A917DIB1_9HYPH|nr:hypothetical protein GCM10011335_48400 [Aureimonas glaciei]